MFELSHPYSPIAAFLRGIKPDPRLTVSEWAEQFRILPPESAEPGRFKMSRTPYMREIADRLSAHDPAQRIIFKKSSQVAGTETGNNWLGYVIDIAPSSFLYVMPTDALMKQTSKTRIDKMIDSSPTIRAKIKPARAKDSKNTIQLKEFEGGFFLGVGANSPVGLASTPVRNVYMDEMDRYPMDVGGEGSAASLAETRTSTFGSRRKIFYTSTPTLEGASAIDNLFKTTDQRRYHVPCPHCGGAQHLVFEQLRYDKSKIRTADFNVQYECIHCRQLIAERHKTQMLAAGEWIATIPDHNNLFIYGYHINALYSPYGWYSWADMAREFEAAQSEIPKLVAFTNTKLGETFNLKGEKPDWELLWSKRETYTKNKPFADVAFITCGVDVQADRLELEIVGWIKGKRSQSIDFRILFGDTTQQPVWDQLEAVLNETFIREDDCIMKISKMAIDTGYNTQHVYNFCRKHSSSIVIPVKGQANQIIMVSHPKVVDRSEKGKAIGRVKIFNIGVSIIKSEIYGWLKLAKNNDESYPAGYCHFPMYDEAHFKSLTAEEFKQTTNKKGEAIYQWVVKYPRNEKLDCRVYARAASAVMGMDRYTDDYWQKMQFSYKKEEKTTEKPKKIRRTDFW